MANATIITGQFVRINQVPASIGERIFARIIDYVVLVFYLISVTYIVDVTNMHRSTGFTLFFVLVFFYVPAMLYSFLFEVFNNGQSIGKKLLKIRVVKADGTTPTLGAYLLRWFLYLFDFNLTGGLGVVLILVTKNNQRLGDLAAGTMVIKEDNYKKIQVSLDEFNHLSENYKPVFPQAADLSLEQVNIITKTLESTSQDRSKLVFQLSAKVADVLSIKRPANDEKFLRTLVRDYQYYALEII